MDRPASKRTLTAADAHGGRYAPGRQRGEILAQADRAGAGRSCPAQHACRARPRRPVDRRIRTRRLSAPRHDHSRESRRCGRDRAVRHRRQADERPAGRPRDRGRQFRCASNRRRIVSHSKGASSRKAARSGASSSWGRSSCRWCCAAPREGVMKAALCWRSRSAAVLLPAARRAIDVSRRRRACRRLSRRGAAPVPSRQMEIPDRRPDRLVAGLRGRRRSISAATTATSMPSMRPMAINSGSAGPADPLPRRRRSPAACCTSAATTASSTRSTRARAPRAGNSPPEASGDSRRRACTACSRRTRPSPIRSTSILSSPVVGGGSVYFGSGDGNVYALDAASGRSAMEIPDGRRRARFACLRRRRRVLRQLGQLLLRGRRRDRKGEMALSRRRRSGDPQPGRIPVVAGGRERRRVHGLPGLEPLCDRRGHRQGEMALQQQREAG